MGIILLKAAREEGLNPHTHRDDPAEAVLLMEAAVGHDEHQLVQGQRREAAGRHAVTRPLKHV